jgi:acyl-CoA synthetase (NDP forming)
MTADILTELKPLFYPRSIAIVGVSTKGDRPGNQFLRILRNFGYKGKIYPVHPTADEINGVNVYATLRDIPDDVDMVNISAPAQYVPGIIADCVDKGVKAAEIFTAGFRETGEEGRLLEAEIRKAAQGRIRIVGPNCFGVYSPGGGLTLLPGVNYPRESGNIGILSQSGGWVTDLVWGADAYNIKFSKVVSYGNGIDLNETSLLEYFAADPDTRVIAAYLEGVSDGNRFKDKVASLRHKKPVIIWKGGLSATGGRAVNSHTGSLAGSKMVWDAFFKQTGAVGVNSFEELLDTMAIFNFLPPGGYTNLGLIGGGGGVGVSASDICEGYGINIPQSTPGILQEVSHLLPAQGTGNKNPFDMGSPLVPPELLQRVMKIVLDWDAVDAVVINRMFFYGIKELMGEKMAEEGQRVKAIIELKQSSPKPILGVLEELASGLDMIEMEADRRRVRDQFIRAGMFVTPTLYRTVRALANFSSYWKGWPIQT